MLATLAEVLREHHALDGAEELACNIKLVKAGIFDVDVFTRGGAFFHVRVKEAGMQPHEYANYCNAWRSFPLHIPQPLGRYFRDCWEIIIILGVPHRPVPAGSVARNRNHLVQQIVEFFKAASEGAREAKPDSTHRAFLRHLQERTADPMCASIVEKWIGEEWLDDLPHIGQHGDFVTDNLGFTDSGLVVFDWEDYARISFPGLDLCTLLVSDTRFDAHKLRAIMGGAVHGADHYAPVVSAACPLMGLTPESFRDLVPLYLVIFRDLKAEYGRAIMEVVSQTIRSVQRT